jgi:DNA polymerase-3 subunit delta'
MKFADIIGNSKIRANLIRAAKRELLPHSLLFYGAEGLGKRLFAKALFSFLNCHSPSENDSCGDCPACRQIDAGTFVDMYCLFQEGKGNKIKIEPVRETCRRLHFEPISGRCKCVLIDDASAMNDEAQNAVLKTLEEPPSKTFFILITAMPDSLLPTILSRCQRIHFLELSGEEVVNYLMDKYDTPSDEAQIAASMSGGSIGSAVNLLLNPVMKEWKDILSKFFSIRHDSYCDLLDFSESIVKTMDEIPLQWMFDLFKLAFRELLLLNMNIAKSQILCKGINLDDVNFARNNERLIENIRLIEKAENAMKLYANPRMVCDWLILNLKKL